MPDEEKCLFCGQTFDGKTIELFCSAYCKMQVKEIVANRIHKLSDRELWELVGRYKLTRAVTEKSGRTVTAKFGIRNNVRVR